MSASPHGSMFWHGRCRFHWSRRTEPLYIPSDPKSKRSAASRPSDQPIVYLAEDDLDLRDLLTTVLVSRGLVVRSAWDGTQLFEWLFRDREFGERLPDLIITDHRMPGYCSLDILQLLEREQWTIPTVVITAYGDEIRSLAMSYGASAVLGKPFDPRELGDLAMSLIDWSVRRLRPKQPVRRRRQPSRPSVTSRTR